MSNTLVLLWGFSCFAVGWLAHHWTYRRTEARRAQVETSPIDLRATLDGGVRIEELRQACRPSFEEARRKR